MRLAKLATLFNPSCYDRGLIGHSTQWHVFTEWLTESIVCACTASSATCCRHRGALGHAWTSGMALQLSLLLVGR